MPAEHNLADFRRREGAFHDFPQPTRGTLLEQCRQINRRRCRLMSCNPCADRVQCIRLAGAAFAEQVREDIPEWLCGCQARPAARCMGLSPHSLMQLIAQRADGLMVRPALRTGDGQCPAVQRRQGCVVRGQRVDQGSSFVAHRRLRLRTPPSFSNSTPAFRSACSTPRRLLGSWRPLPRAVPRPARWLKCRPRRLLQARPSSTRPPSRLACKSSRSVGV
jgi:hypothetical protein